jgi:hypothetical protein
VRFPPLNSDMRPFQQKICINTYIEWCTWVLLGQFHQFNIHDGFERSLNDC